ncbi:MAG: hypothetical protein ACUVX8_11590 [Candidatus Zipacnadales bacterium]
MKCVLSVVIIVGLSLILLGTPIQAAPPAPPSSLAVWAPPGQNGTRLQVDIGASPDDGSGSNDVDRYWVERRKNVTDPWVRVLVIPANGSSLYSAIDRPLQLGITYYYRAAAYNGEVSDWIYATGTTQDTARPGAPGLTVTDRLNDQGFVLQVTIKASPDDGGGADDVVNYRVKRRVGGGTFVFLRTIQATDQPEYVFMDRVDYKKRRYDYKVVAFDGVNFSAPAIAGATAQDNTPPAPPRDLRVVDFPDDQGKQLLIRFRRSLDDGSGANDVRQYRVSRRKAGETSFTRIALVRATGTGPYEVKDWGLEPGTWYTYKVVAWDGRNISTPVIKGAQTKDNIRPRPPTKLVATDHPDDQGTALDLSWGASPDDGGKANDVKEYHIFRDPGPEATSALALVAKVPAKKQATYRYTDTGLRPRQKYSYVVRAFDGFNLSKPVSGSGRPFDQKKPRPPYRVTVRDVPNDNGGAVTVSFRGSPDDGAGADDVKTYEIRRRKGTGRLIFLKTVNATDSTLYTFTDSGLTDNIPYTYSIRAFDGTQYSVPAEGKGQAHDNTPPRPPRNFRVVVAQNALGGANITFEASLDDTKAHPEVVRYEIFRKLAGGDWPSQPTLMLRATQAASYTKYDSDLTLGKKYVYKARAKGLTGYSPFTEWQTITARDTRVPAPPTNLEARDRPDDEGKAVIVTWRRSADDGIGRNIVAKYRIYRQLTSVFEPPIVKVGTVRARGAARYQFVDASNALMNYRSYTYWAVAVSATDVPSAPSNKDEAVPEDNIILAAPTNLTAQDETGTSGAIQLSWKRSSSEGGGVTPPPPPFFVSHDVAAITGQYEVFRRKAGTEWSDTAYRIVPQSVEGNPIVIVDSPVPNGVTYQYKVRYRVGTAISPFSNVAQAAAKNDSSANANTAGDSGLTVAITNAPAFVTAGETASIVVTVRSIAPSVVHLEWSTDDSTWNKTALRSGKGTYTANFDITPGIVRPGAVLRIVAVATDAQEETRSEEVVIEINS